jgi:hypothetical protein
MQQVNSQQLVLLRLLLQDTPLYEVLYQESTALNQRKKEMRVRAEAEMLSTCTFAPKLTSQQLVKSGRVMQVRAVHQNSLEPCI